MTLIAVDTRFIAFDTSGDGKLDKDEVAAAHAKGCVWAKEGQTEAEYDQAKANYDARKKEEFMNTFNDYRKQSGDSIFNELIKKSRQQNTYRNL